MTRPVVWAIGGTDSGGGAGLTADQRSADAFGVHLCPVAAAVTAQHSRAVTRIEPMPAELIDAQLSALADDMPPAAVKTGLLGGVDQVMTVSRWIDRLRERAPVALVVDPVLCASSGAAFADSAVRQAYRDELLPRATLVTPNRREALALLGDGSPHGADSVPDAADALRRLGARTVCITGGDSDDAEGLHSLDWLASAHADGWLASPRIATAHNHGTGCTFATAAAAASALGFVPADAVVLAKMATAHALRHGYAAGAGAGPVQSKPGFGTDAALMPLLSWGREARFAPPRTAVDRRLGLYAVVDSAARLAQVVDAGVRSVQLRIKAPERPDAAWHAHLRSAVQASVRTCRAAGAELFVNDHWRLARELGAGGVHLGQEDLIALGEDGRRELLASGLSLGVSSHSLWELCRARSLAPRYVACGPVWPTLTKAMPWRAQGLDNLAWWQRMAGAPVAAIGGILDAGRVEAAARCGVDGVCVVRGLSDEPATTVPALLKAVEVDRVSSATAAHGLPHPTLEQSIEAHDSRPIDPTPPARR